MRGASVATRAAPPFGPLHVPGAEIPDRAYGSMAEATSSSQPNPVAPTPPRTAGSGGLGKSHSKQIQLDPTGPFIDGTARSARNGIEPAPEQEKKRAWKQLRRAHWESLPGCDVFCVAALGLGGPWSFPHRSSGLASAECSTSAFERLHEQRRRIDGPLAIATAGIEPAHADIKDLTVPAVKSQADEPTWPSRRPPGRRT